LVKKEPMRALYAAIGALVPAGDAQPLPGTSSRPRSSHRPHALPRQALHAALAPAAATFEDEELVARVVDALAPVGPHLVRNGLLFRSDLHRLFDQGYITVDDDLRLVVSARLKQEYSNGRT
jgi:hypothetical protein